MTNYKINDIIIVMKEFKEIGLMTTTQAAKAVGITRAAVHFWISQGWIKAYDAGSFYLLFASDVRRIYRKGKDGRGENEPILPLRELGYLSIKQAAEEVGVTTQTIHVWVKKGWLLAYSSGTVIIVRAKDIPRAIELADESRERAGKGGMRLYELKGENNA